MSITPRINGAYLAHHLNQTVRLVGRVNAMDAVSGQLQLQTSDSKLISCSSQALAAGGADAAVYQIGRVIEMVGMLQQDGSVQEYMAISMGDNFGPTDTQKHRQRCRRTDCADALRLTAAAALLLCGCLSQTWRSTTSSSTSSTPRVSHSSCEQETETRAAAERDEAGCALLLLLLSSRSCQRM